MQNIVTDATAPTANDYNMARDMAEALHAHYPGQRWAVTCEGAQGIATIRNLLLSGTYGYLLKLPAIYSASAFKKDVIHAGGEILERFKMPRGNFNQVSYESLKMNFAGHMEFDR